MHTTTEPGKVYGQFYDSTRTERGLVNKVRSPASTMFVDFSFARQVTTPVSDCWHPSRFGGEIQPSSVP